MYLYEKNNGNIVVYELKENRDKIIEYKKQEMNKLSKDELVYKLLFSSFNPFNILETIKCESVVSEKTKKLKNKLLIENILYNNTTNKIMIDGFLHNYYEGAFDNIDIKYIKDGDNIVKSLLIPENNATLVQEANLFSSDVYEIPYALSLPESLVILKDLRNELLKKVYDKNIDEQLALFDFNNEPVGSYDIDLINILIKHDLCGRRKTDECLDLSQNVLKKVKMLNK